LSGDADRQKGFCSFIRRLTISAIAIKGLDLIPEGMEFLLQSLSPEPLLLSRTSCFYIKMV
jgi:hypothetical protein